MDETEKTARDVISDDQRAIADYFASDSYRAAKLERVATRSIDDHPLLSVAMLLIGLLIACSVGAVIVLKMIEKMDAAPPFATAILLIDFMIFPITTVMTFSIVIAFFWHGPLWRRVLVSMSIVVPGIMVFLGLSKMVMEFGVQEFVINVSAAFFGVFVGASATTILVEMFSPFTLMAGHHVDQKKFAPTSLRAFFELTIFCAIIFVAVSIFSDGDLLIVTFVAAIWSTLLAISAIASVIAFLNDDQPSRAALIIAGIGCALPSFFMTGANAMGGFGWAINVVNFVSVAMFSLIGVAIQAAFLAVGIRIVRSQGCVCVNRRKNQIGGSMRAESG